MQYTLPNISWSKGNQTMTYGQLIEYKKRNVFLQKSCKKWGRETSPRLLFVFKKSFIWGKSKFQYISIVHNLACNIIKRCRTWDYWSRDMLNFDFLQKGLGIVYNILRKMFLILYFINWPNPLLDYLYFWRYWTMCALQLFVNQALFILILTLSF